MSKAYLAGIPENLSFPQQPRHDNGMVKRGNEDVVMGSGGPKKPKTSDNAPAAGQTKLGTFLQTYEGTKYFKGGYGEMVHFVFKVTSELGQDCKDAKNKPEDLLALLTNFRFPGAGVNPGSCSPQSEFDEHAPEDYYNNNYLQEIVTNDQSTIVVEVGKVLANCEYVKKNKSSGVQIWKKAQIVGNDMVTAESAACKVAALKAAGLIKMKVMETTTHRMVEIDEDEVEVKGGMNEIVDCREGDVVYINEDKVKIDVDDCECVSLEVLFDGDECEVKEDEDEDGDEEDEDEDEEDEGGDGDEDEDE